MNSLRAMPAMLVVLLLATLSATSARKLLGNPSGCNQPGEFCCPTPLGACWCLPIGEDCPSYSPYPLGERRTLEEQDLSQDARRRPINAPEMPAAPSSVGIPLLDVQKSTSCEPTEQCCRRPMGTCMCWPKDMSCPNFALPMAPLVGVEPADGLLSEQVDVPAEEVEKRKPVVSAAAAQEPADRLLSEQVDVPPDGLQKRKPFISATVAANVPAQPLEFPVGSVRAAALADTVARAEPADAAEKRKPKE